jgi:phage gpG-like protein
MSIVVSFNGTDKLLIDKFVRMGDKLVGDVAMAMRREMQDLSNYIKTAKLSGRPGLRNLTGNLRRSVFPSAFMESRTAVVGKVAVGSEAPYARFQEYGAHIPPLEPVNKKALSNINSIGARRGDAPWGPYRRTKGATLPARPFMGTSLQERRGVIMAGLRNAVNNSVIG